MVLFLFLHTTAASSSSTVASSSELLVEYLRLGYESLHRSWYIGVILGLVSSFAGAMGDNLVRLSFVRVRHSMLSHVFPHARNSVVSPFLLLFSLFSSRLVFFFFFLSLLLSLSVCVPLCPSPARLKQKSLASPPSGESKSLRIYTSHVCLLRLLGHRRFLHLLDSLVRDLQIQAEEESLRMRKTTGPCFRGCTRTRRDLRQMRVWVEETSRCVRLAVSLHSADFPFFLSLRFESPRASVGSLSLYLSGSLCP